MFKSRPRMNTEILFANSFLGLNLTAMLFNEAFQKQTGSLRPEFVLEHMMVTASCHSARPREEQNQRRFATSPRGRKRPPPPPRGAILPRHWGSNNSTHTGFPVTGEKVPSRPPPSFLQPLRRNMPRAKKWRS